MNWAKQGKTFIFHHPNFVAIDRKTWDKINEKLHPKPYVIFDEASEVTPEMEKLLADRLQ